MSDEAFASANAGGGEAWTLLKVLSPYIKPEDRITVEAKLHDWFMRHLNVLEMKLWTDRELMRHTSIDFNKENLYRATRALADKLFQSPNIVRHERELGFPHQTDRYSVTVWRSAP